MGVGLAGPGLEVFLPVLLAHRDAACGQQLRQGGSDRALIREQGLRQLRARLWSARQGGQEACAEFLRLQASVLFMPTFCGHCKP